MKKESVWDYPRPPRVEPVAQTIRIILAGRAIVETRDAKRVLETSYPDPTPAFAMIRDHLAVYPAAMDACFVDDEQVTPQPGRFYGGWVTSNLVGPFKGAPGTMGW